MERTVNTHVSDDVTQSLGVDFLMGPWLPSIDNINLSININTDMNI